MTTSKPPSANAAGKRSRQAVSGSGLATTLLLSRLPGMNELTVTSLLIPQNPTVAPKHFQHVTDLHDSASVRLSVRRLDHQSTPAPRPFGALSRKRTRKTQ